MLRLDKEIHNPAEMMSQMRDTTNQMEDYYYGGWQEVLPNSAAGIYRGATLGQHGEIWMIPWKYAIIENSLNQVVLKCWTRPLRLPLLIEKTLTLKNNSTTLLIDEQLTNEGRTDLDIMWGHHIAFGLPFLRKGGFIETNAKKIVAEKSMPDHRIYAPEIEGDWPQIMSKNHELVDAAIIPPESAMPYSDLAYLSGFDSNGFYTIYNQNAIWGFPYRGMLIFLNTCGIGRSVMRLRMHPGGVKPMPWPWSHGQPNILRIQRHRLQKEIIYILNQEHPSNHRWKPRSLIINHN